MSRKQWINLSAGVGGILFFVALYYPDNRVLALLGGLGFIWLMKHESFL